MTFLFKLRTLLDTYRCKKCRAFQKLPHICYVSFNLGAAAILFNVIKIANPRGVRDCFEKKVTLGLGLDFYLDF